MKWEQAMSESSFRAKVMDSAIEPAGGGCEGRVTNPPWPRFLPPIPSKSRMPSDLVEPEVTGSVHPACPQC